MEIGNYIITKALKLGVDDVVVTIKPAITKQLRFANNEITLSTTWDTIDVSVFLAYKKRLISSSLNNPSLSETFSSMGGKTNLTKDSVDKFLEKMLKVAKVLAPKEDYHGIAKGPFKYKPVKDSYDKKIESLGDKTVDFVEDAIGAATDEGAKRCAGVLYSSFWEENKFTSGGVEASDKGSSINVSIRAFAEKDASGHSVSVSRVMKEFDAKLAGKEAGMLAKQSLNPVAGESGKYDVILGPMVAANLLYYMSYAFSAFEVDSGTSFLINKIGKKVGSKEVTLVDDSRMENGFGSNMFDDEGMPTQRTKIIDKGVLKTYLHNTSTAKKFKTKSTANAGIIYPQPNNLVLESGDSSLEEMISDVKDGVYITNVWYTRFANYRTGDFSTIPRDAMFEIKNGKIIRPIKGLRLSDNMQHILENIISVSKAAKIIHWWEVEIPIVTGHVLCKDLNMTKSAK